MGTLTVPYPFDVVIDGQGYVFADQEEQKAAFGLSPVYISRQNTQGDYGDNQQDFWLTWSQKDWSKGEQQRYQGRDDDGKARYYFGEGVDVSVPGEVTQRKTTTSLSFAAAPVSATPSASADLIYVATSTTLYHVAYDGTITSDGAHGLGAAPSRWGMCVAGGGVDVFLSTTSAGTVGVRRWNGAAFATFSATGADALASLNNSLYGYRSSAGTLVRYDTAGVATVLYTWQNDEGAALAGVTCKLMPLGGKLLILRYRGSGNRSGAEIWQYDGTSTSQIAEFPANFVVYDMEVLNGTIFVSGAVEKHVSSTVTQRPTIYFYKDGSQDVLWQGLKYTGGTCTTAITAFQHGLIWLDRSYNNNIVFYDPINGGVSRGDNNQAATTNHILTSASTFYINASTGTTAGILWPASSGAAETTSAVFSSLIDFDTSLRKIFRGVRVEFDAATDGNGGSVDISYRYDELTTDLTYTTLQTGAVSGTEYKISPPAEGTNYRAISVKVALNKGTSTNGPVLRRVQVRAVPVTTAFKQRTYVFNCTGRDGDSPVILRDGSTHSLDGLTMATNLQTAAGRSSPFTIIDHLGTYTGVVEDLNMVEVRPEEYVVTVKAREV